MNYVLILGEMGGDATLTRMVWEAMSTEFFYINLLKQGHMIHGNCKCAKIDKN